MPKSSARSSKSLLILMVVMMASVAVAVVVMWYRIADGPRDPGYASAAAVAIGGPFSLIDQNGAPVTDQTYKGLYRLIYFGYTFCPDACPTELQVMAQAVDEMGADGDKVQPIFVTIDPARDTPKQLLGYVPLFHKRLVGLTGTAEQIAQMAREYKVYYAKADQSASYAMNHSSFVYLIDPEGKFITVFSSDTDSEKMASEIKRYMKG